MPLAPLDYSDLTVDVDDDIYARLQYIKAVFDPASGIPQDEFERTRQYRLMVRAGHPHLVNVKDKFDATPLKNWIMSPPKGYHVYVNNGNRRNLKHSNLSVVPPAEGHQFREDHPAPDEPAVTERGYTWVPELQGFVADWYTRRPLRQEHHKTKPKIHWKARQTVPCFSSPDAGLAFYEARREARQRARVQQQDDDVELPPTLQIGDAVEAGNAPSDAVYPFVPLAARLSGAGRNWGRQGQTSFLVMIGLQFYCLKIGQRSLLADHHSIGAKLGMSSKTVQRAINHLESTQAIKKTPRRSSSLTKDKGRHFRNNLPPECTFPDEPDYDQPHGRFPTKLFDNPKFLELETLHKAVLAALYLMALGNAQVQGQMKELQAHASVAEHKYIKAALLTLNRAGFLQDCQVAKDGSFRATLMVVV